jgi:hypothetical protein
MEFAVTTPALGGAVRLNPICSMNAPGKPPASAAIQTLKFPLPVKRSPGAKGPAVTLILASTKFKSPFEVCLWETEGVTFNKRPSNSVRSRKIAENHYLSFDPRDCQADGHGNQSHSLKAAHNHLPHIYSIYFHCRTATYSAGATAGAPNLNISGTREKLDVGWAGLCPPAPRECVPASRRHRFASCVRSATSCGVVTQALSR